MQRWVASRDGGIPLMQKRWHPANLAALLSAATTSTSVISLVRPISVLSGLLRSVSFVSPSLFPQVLSRLRLPVLMLLAMLL